MPAESKFVWMDGKLVDYEKAVVHINSPAMHYGAAVFEGIRAYNTPKGPAVFRLTDHIERLFMSMRIFGVQEFPFSVEDIIQASKDVVQENEFTDCYIRPLIFLRDGIWSLNITAGKISISVSAWEWNNYLGKEALAKGIRANISSFTRHHPNVTMTKAKAAGNYVNSILAKTESDRLGFQEAIMLDPQGYVAECTGENLFIVRNKKVITPSTAPILEGITRQSLAIIANDLGYEVDEQPISRDQLYNADEVFVCGTAAEVIGLCEIDFRKIGDGKSGQITEEIQKVYHEAIRGKIAKYEHWCEYIN